METNVKRFETKLDFDEIRRSLAEAMVVLQGDESEKKTTEPVGVHKKAIAENAGKKAEKLHRDDGFVYVTASVVAGVLLSGLAAVVGVKAHRS